jgi:glucose-specific phosphotransferase system IIA component
MFDFFKKSMELVAPIAGKVIDLSEVPDQVFAQKMAGDGVGIDSTGDIIVSPADGVIALIFKTNHAFAMTLDNGIEILVHIGIDTVELNGTGFERLVEEGTKVKSGTPVIKINREFIKEKGYSLVTPVLITNPDNLKEIKYNSNIVVEAGKDAVITYKSK